MSIKSLDTTPHKYLDTYEKNMNETMKEFSPLNIRTICNTEAFRSYKDVQTVVDINKLVNELPRLDVNDSLMEKFIRVVSDKNFDMFNYVEYLKQDKRYIEFAEEHKGMSVGQMVFLYTSENDKEIKKSLEETKESYQGVYFDTCARIWANERRINETLAGLDDNSDFKTYESSFSSIRFPAKRFVLSEFSEDDDCCSVRYSNIATGESEIGGVVPKECAPFLKKGSLVIFDGAIKYGANRAVTFYTPEGKLLGGYKDVNGKKEIIKPKKNSNIFGRIFPKYHS